MARNKVRTIFEDSDSLIIRFHIFNVLLLPKVRIIEPFQGIEEANVVAQPDPEPSSLILLNDFSMNTLFNLLSSLISE